MFQRRFSSFSKSVQNFLRERDVSNIGTHIKDDDMNSQCTHDGTTVLMMVCTYSHAYNPLRYSYYIPHAVEKVKWLLSKGADVNIKNHYGCTALMWAAGYSKPVKIYKGKRFMEKFESYNIHPVEQKINHKLSLMIVHYFNKDNYKCKSSEKIVEILLKAGADPNKQNHFGDTALMYAARNSSPERGESSERTVEILLKAGADPNKQNHFGDTALIHAARASSPERGYSSERTVEILLQARADTNKSTVSGWTALIYAACYSSPEIGYSSEKTVKILLGSGADPNKRSIGGTYALALTLADTPSVKQLIQKYL